MNRFVGFVVPYLCVGVKGCISALGECWLSPEKLRGWLDQVRGQSSVQNTLLPLRPTVVVLSLDLPRILVHIMFQRLPSEILI